MTALRLLLLLSTSLLLHGCTVRFKARFYNMSGRDLVLRMGEDEIVAKAGEQVDFLNPQDWNLHLRTLDGKVRKKITPPKDELKRNYRTGLTDHWLEFRITRNLSVEPQLDRNTKPAL